MAEHEHLGISTKTMDNVCKETREEGDEREIKATIEGTATMLDKHGRIKNRAIKWGGNILTFQREVLRTYHSSCRVSGSSLKIVMIAAPCAMHFSIEKHLGHQTISIFGGFLKCKQ